MRAPYFRDSGKDPKTHKNAAESGRKKLRAGEARAKKAAAKAKAVSEGVAVPLAELKIPKKPLMFIDIETDLAQSYVWLISVCAEGCKRPAQFYAESPDQEKSALEGFLGHLEKSGDCALCYWSGAGFDERVVKQRMASYRLGESALATWFDLCAAVKKSVVLPTSSFSVKAVGAYAGYRYAHLGLDGAEAALEYQITIGRRKPAVSKKLLEYGKDDVFVMDRIVEKIGSVAGLSRDSNPEPLPASFERECALFQDLQKRQMRTAEMAERFGKSAAYVRTRLKQSPRAAKGLRVSLRGYGARGLSGRVVRQISPTVFEVKFGESTATVNIKHLAFAEAPPGAP